MTGLREKKKAQTRAALARAAAEIARFEGPEMQNIGAISERADVSPRTFHNYFSSREEALREFTLQTVTDLLDSLKESSATTVAEAVEEAVIKGLRRGDDELTSFYSLNMLIQEVSTPSTALLSEQEKAIHMKVLREFHEAFPQVGLFDLAAQLAAAASVAQFALSYYYAYVHEAGEEAAGENIVRRAFDQGRSVSLGKFVRVPSEVMEDVDSLIDWVN